MKSYIRQLTKDEHNVYAGALAVAINVTPSFRDLLALLRPFRDESFKTCYVDPYARLGLGNMFFKEWDTPRKRAEALIHEAMHIGNLHHTRIENIGASGKEANIAADFEINSAIIRLPGHVNKHLIRPDENPWNLELNKPLEYYYIKLHDGDDSGSNGDSDDTENNTDESDDSDTENDENPTGEDSSESDTGQDSEGTGDTDGENSEQGQVPAGEGSGDPDVDGGDTENGWFCGEATEARQKAADEAGVYRMSPEEQIRARQDAQARIVEELQKNRNAGTSEGDEFLEIAFEQMKPPKADWKAITRKQLGRVRSAIIRGNQDYTFRRPNRRTLHTNLIFPGLVQYPMKSMLAVDTSMSMQKSDYNSVFPEVEALLKEVANSLEVFTVDVKASDMQKVGSVRDIEFIGGGGTNMAIAFRIVNELPRAKQPDLFVLATDGGFYNWQEILTEIKKAQYQTVILITDETQFNQVPSEVHRVATIIDVSPPEW